MKTLEVVIFKANVGTADEQMIAAAKKVQSVIERMPGNINRNFGKTESGEWVDAVMWDSMESAKSAAESIMSIPEFKPFGSLIDGSSVQMRHVEIFY